MMYNSIAKANAGSTPSPQSELSLDTIAVNYLQLIKFQ